MTESSGGQEGRDPESVNRSKRRRSERFARRDVEEDSSDESMGEDDDDVKNSYRRKSFQASRIADGMIGVPVPRKARSGSILFYLLLLSPSFLIFKIYIFLRRSSIPI